MLFRIQQRRPFRIKRLQHLKPVFDLHIFRNRNLRVARIQFERIFAQRYLARIVAVQRPVPRINRRLLLRRSEGKVISVRYAVAVCNDYRRSRIAICLGHRLNRLHLVCAKRNLGDIYIAVVYRKHSKILLRCGFTFRSELRDSPERRRFAHLPTSIGVHFRIHYHYIDVFAACQNMVETAVSDIVRPAVAAENPNCLIYEIP